MDETKGKLLPIYFVADVSTSMTNLMGELNRGLTSLLDALALDSVGAAKLRFTVLSFSVDGVCELDLADLRKVERMPQFSVRGGTFYGVVFRDLRPRIERDFAKLKGEGYLVHRPAVFFLTDGQPTDEDWPAALAELKRPDWPLHPNIVAFGISEADARIIEQVASDPKFGWIATDGGADTGKVLAQFFDAFTHSLPASARALAAGKAEFPVEAPAGFTMVEDVIKDYPASSAGR